MSSIDLQEVEECAAYLGIDTVMERHLLWIAEEALLAPLPLPWKEYFDDNREVYFYNSETDLSTREHPMDVFYRELYQRLRGQAKPPAEDLPEQDGPLLVTPDDVRRMGEYLGIALPAEYHHLWIARRALLAPLPEGWEEHRDPEDNVFYYSSKTDESTREHPFDGLWRQCLQDARETTPVTATGFSPWMEFVNDAGKCYYFNWLNGKSQTRRPVDPPPSPKSLGTALGSGVVGSPEVHCVTTQQRRFQVKDRQPKAASPKSGKSGKLGRSARSESSAWSQTVRKNSGAAPGSITDLRILNFKSWWTEKGQRHFMDIFYNLEDGSARIMCEIVIGEMEIYELPFLADEHKIDPKPLTAWDLYIGATVNVLGKLTTLHQADLVTLQWHHHHEQRLLKLADQILTERSKYASGPASLMVPRKRRDPGTLNLTRLRKEIGAQLLILSKFRPSLVETYEKKLARGDCGIRVSEFEEKQSAERYQMRQRQLLVADDD